MNPLSQFSSADADNNDEPATVNGLLVIEFTDSGAGLSLEQKDWLFKEIIQFNPEKHQAGFFFFFFFK